VRVRVPLRWLGFRPGRVQVNAQERFGHESVQTAWFHAPAERRGPARRPGHPPGALAQPTPAAPSPGLPAWAEGASAAPPLLNRPQIVREPSRKDPASFPEGSRKDPGRIPRSVYQRPVWFRLYLCRPARWPGLPSKSPRTLVAGASGTPRSGRSAGHPPGAPAHRPAPRPRPGRRRGLTPLPPPGRPRIGLEPSRKDPASVPHRSPYAHAGRRTSVWPPARLPKPATVHQPLRGPIRKRAAADHVGEKG
jgi:hypothetical protein